MTNPEDSITQGVAGMATTAVATAITWLDFADHIVDIGAGITAIVAGIFTIVWTYHKIKELRNRNGDK